MSEFCRSSISFCRSGVGSYESNRGVGVKVVSLRRRCICRVPAYRFTRLSVLLYNVCSDTQHEHPDEGLWTVTRVLFGQKWK